MGSMKQLIIISGHGSSTVMGRGEQLVNIDNYGCSYGQGRAVYHYSKTIMSPVQLWAEERS